MELTLRPIFQQGRVEEGIHHLRAALALNPFNIMAHNNLGFALASQGKTGEALGHYREVLWINPNCALAHNNWGYALACQNKLDDAIGHYRQALQLDPRYAMARVNLRNALLSRATAYATGGRFPEAAQSAREAAGLSGVGQDKELTERIAKRIAAYETRQSYHEREP